MLDQFLENTSQQSAKTTPLLTQAMKVLGLTTMRNTSMLMKEVLTEQLKEKNDILEFVMDDKKK